jgi:hypothetical protein
VTRRVGLWLLGGAALAIALGSGWVGARFWFVPAEKRVRVVVPGRLVRGAWQQPAALRAIIARERIKTIVTLTAINRNDPKFVGQADVVSSTGVSWFIVPMRGSRATLAQMAEAADLLADPGLQPIFFHCVAGHHRTGLAHAAYLIRHCGMPAEGAWKAISGMPWARPPAEADQADKAIIEEFARVQHRLARDARTRVPEVVHDDGEDTLAPQGRLGRGAPGRYCHPAGLVCGVGSGEL